MKAPCETCGAEFPFQKRAVPASPMYAPPATGRVGTVYHVHCPHRGRPQIVRQKLPPKKGSP